MRLKHEASLIIAEDPYC